KGRVSDSFVTDYVDHGRLTRFKGPLQCGNDVIGVFDIFTVTAHLGENFVVANVLQNVEGVGAVFEERHRFEARTPRTVVPEYAYDREVVASGRLHIEAADAEASVAHSQHYLCAGPC